MQMVGMAFVLAVVLNLSVVGAHVGKGPRPKRDTRSAEKQFPPPNALRFANLLRQAQHGDKRAQTHVGIAFAKGEIASQNPYEAVRWFSEAAEAGDPQAQHNLGIMLYLGMGVERNLSLAAKWFETAAAAGVAQAQFRAGAMYENGEVRITAKLWLCCAKLPGRALLLRRTTSATCTKRARA